MEVNDIVRFCDSNWESPKCSKGCDNICQGHCIKCLEHIHKVYTHDRTYNCPNIVHCYTCKYIYKYSSEIYHILKLLCRTLKIAKQVRATSIGCGPASELFGLCQYRSTHKLEFKIEYKGFEETELWKPIHTRVCQMNTVDTIDFIYSDVFEYYKQNEDYPNLLILNYVISDVVRRYPIEKRYSFLQSLVELIENMPKGSFVLVNDINLGNNEKGARYYHSIICQKLQAKGIQIKDIKLHFKSSLPYYFHYGNEMPNNHIVGNIPNDIEAKYDPWDECRSAALIFRKDS